MKAVITLLTLAAIVFVYILGATLYIKEEFFFAYSLVVASLTSFIFWIRNVSALLEKQRA